MDKNKNYTNVGIGVSILVGGLIYLAQSYQLNSSIIIILYLLSYFSFIWGCFYYAKSKGYSGWVGLIGLLSLLGLLILAFLPDKNIPANKQVKNYGKTFKDMFIAALVYVLVAFLLVIGLIFLSKYIKY